MDNFRFAMPTQVLFGQDTESQVGEEVKKWGSKVLLHYGGGSIIRSGLKDTVEASLKAAGIDFVELGGVKPNPRLSLVHEGIDLCRREGVDFILAVGGGSVIDSAKAIAVGLNYDGDVWDYYAGKQPVTEMLPLGVILTIPAAGSEASSSSVITNEDGWRKVGLGSEHMRPKFAIMNPELTMTLPPYQTACGAADIMAHVMERYFTNTKDVDFTDKMCEAVLRTIIKQVPIALDAPDDYAARAEIMWASTIAHNDLLSTGRVGDWASHQIEHELSAKYDIAHGAGLAIVFPAWMKHVYKHDVERFAQFGVRVWNVEYDFANPERTALGGIQRLKQFFRSIGLPVSLADADIDDTHLQEMAELCGSTGNFVKLNSQDILTIYQLALQ